MPLLSQSPANRVALADGLRTQHWRRESNPSAFCLLAPGCAARAAGFLVRRTARSADSSASTLQAPTGGRGLGAHLQLGLDATAKNPRLSCRRPIRAPSTPWGCGE